MAFLAGCAGAPVNKTPVCCVDYGLDVTSILGGRYVDCGAFRMPPRSVAHRASNDHALSCALLAQAQGRAFIYRVYHSGFPDIAIENIAVVGAKSERLVMEKGIYGSEEIPPSAGRCAHVRVERDGSISWSDCPDGDPLIERLTMPADGTAGEK